MRSWCWSTWRSFGVSGLLGLVFLLRTLQRLRSCVRTGGRRADARRTESSGEGGGRPSSRLRELDPLEDQVLGRNVKTVFRCWVILFGLVGAQMSWVLRPFIGRPGLPFVWFRDASRTSSRRSGRRYRAPVMILRETRGSSCGGPTTCCEGVDGLSLVVAAALRPRLRRRDGSVRRTLPAGRLLRDQGTAAAAGNPGLSLPSYFVANTLVGLRADFATALRAIVARRPS